MTASYLRTSSLSWAIVKRANENDLRHDEGTHQVVKAEHVRIPSVNLIIILFYFNKEKEQSYLLFFVDDCLSHMDETNLKMGGGSMGLR